MTEWPKERDTQTTRGEHKKMTTKGFGCDERDGGRFNHAQSPRGNTYKKEETGNADKKESMTPVSGMERRERNPEDRRRSPLKLER